MLSMGDDYFMMEANDLDKDSMAVHIINEDHLSGSQFYAPPGGVGESSNVGPLDLGRLSEVGSLRRPTTG